MDGTEVFLHFEVEEGADREAIARLLQERLGELESVREAEATPEETMLTGAEIVAGIAVGLAIARGARDLTAEVRKVIAEVTALVREIHGLKRALVEVGPQRVPAEQIDDGQVAALAAG